MKKRSFTYIITFIILSLSIGYSAFGSELLVSNLVAEVRVEADVRVTDFLYSGSTANGLSSYENYDVDSVISTISLPNSDSSVTYKFAVTNFGNAEVGIFQITGLPSNLIYELSEYTLKDKICDSSGKCSLGAVKEFYITIKYGVYDSTDTLYDLKLDFDFRNFYTVTNVNITDISFPSEVIAGDTLSVDLSSNPPEVVGVLNESGIVDFTYSNNILNVDNVSSNLEIGGAYTSVYNYSYIGDAQEFTVPFTGIYKIELWGAGYTNGGYVSGKIDLMVNDSLYVYVGQYGYGTVDNIYTVFNGGGGATEYDGHIGPSGTGATDVRLVNGDWKNFASLKSRILVASGGASGGAGGGLIGGALASDTWEYPYVGHGATQTAGGDEPLVFNDLPNNQGTAGEFGYGGTGGTGYVESGGSGGGGGYYGGSGASGCYGGWWPGGGGSSFISGHNGCDAINEISTESNIVHTGQSVHYSGYKFFDTVMVDGAGYNWTNVKGEYVGMPTHDGTSVMTGNDGNGYAKITLTKITDF